MLQDALNNLNKALPHNLEAERTVLGAILIDNENFYPAAEILTEADFYREGHRVVFQRMRELLERAEVVDLVTLNNELTRTNELEILGGISYVAGLVDGVPRSSNVGHYARIVKGKALLRRLISEAQGIISECIEETGPTDELLDRAEGRIFDVAEKRLRTGFVPFKDIARSTLDILDQIHERHDSLTGVATGFVQLDEMTSGLQPQDLIILAARPSMGKTAFALDITRHVAVKGGSIGIFSLEMSKEQLALRLLCAEAQVNSHQLRTGKIGDKEWARLTTAVGRLAETRIAIDDSPAQSVLEMKSKARRLKAETGLDLLIVDYIQLMHGGGTRAENRQQEISTISRGLKALAKELRIPVVGLSQLSRASEARSDHKPQLSDLRESGALEQDADVVLFIFREEVYKPTEENKGLCEIIIGKQRNGPIGTVELVFLKDFPRFENMEWRPE